MEDREFFGSIIDSWQNELGEHQVMVESDDGRLYVCTGWVTSQAQSIESGCEE